MKRRGFTLIELLVVIAIIAILAAILFPIFMRAREAGKRAACLSNLRQIGIAVQMYRDDWDAFPASGRYPSPDSPTSGNPWSGWWWSHWGYGFWMGQAEPYIKSKNIYRCLSARKDAPGSDRNFLGSEVPVASYGYNEYLAYTPAAKPNRAAQTIYWQKPMKYPSLTAMVADESIYQLFGDWWDSEPDGNYMLGDGVPLPSTMVRVKYAGGLVNGRLVARHEGSNILYCDHHAKWMSLKGFAYQSGGGVKRERPLIDPAAQPY